MFLDEIGELPLLLQAKLLRFLQEGVITRLGSNDEIKLDVRIIAATHRDLPKRIVEKEFREDLYYRLNVVPLRMPSLTERKEDIPSLLNHFIKKFQKQYSTDTVNLSIQAKKALLSYSWHGHVR